MMMKPQHEHHVKIHNIYIVILLLLYSLQVIVLCILRILNANVNATNQNTVAFQKTHCLFSYRNTHIGERHLKAVPRLTLCPLYQTPCFRDSKEMYILLVLISLKKYDPLSVPISQQCS